MGQELRSILLTDAEFAFATGLYFDGRRDVPVKAGNIGTVHRAPRGRTGRRP